MTGNLYHLKFISFFVIPAKAGIQVSCFPLHIIINPNIEKTLTIAPNAAIKIGLTLKLMFTPPIL